MASDTELIEHLMGWKVNYDKLMEKTVKLLELAQHRGLAYQRLADDRSQIIYLLTMALEKEASADTRRDMAYEALRILLAQPVEDWDEVLLKGFPGCVACGCDRCNERNAVVVKMKMSDDYSQIPDCCHSGDIVPEEDDHSVELSVLK